MVASFLGSQEDHTIEMHDKKKESMLSVYYCTIEKDFHLWELHVKAALHRKDLIEAREERPVH